MMRNALPLVVALLILHLLVVDSSAQDSSGQINVEKPTVPEIVLNAELKSVSGKSFRLSDYSGKVLVLHFWATWCSPCRFETPFLVKLQKEFKAQDVRMLELSTEKPEVAARDVRRWIRTYRVKHDVGWLTNDVTLLMRGQQSLPQTFVIGRDARIVRRFIGYSPTKTPVEMRKAIEEALH